MSKCESRNSEMPTHIVGDPTHVGPTLPTTALLAGVWGVFFMLLVLLALLFHTALHPPFPPGSQLLAWAALLVFIPSVFLTFLWPLLISRPKPGLTHRLRMAGCVLAAVAWMAAVAFLQWIAACDSDGICHWTVPM